MISIHASRMGCDYVIVATDRRRVRISIHASRMGCDRDAVLFQLKLENFNPRIPYGMRRSFSQFIQHPIQHFNPRIPYGMRRVIDSREGVDGLVFQSTHPVWDATGRCMVVTDLFGEFQSTHPVWDAT